MKISSLENIGLHSFSRDEDHVIMPRQEGLTLLRASELSAQSRAAASRP